MTVQNFVKIVWTVFEKFENFMKRSGEKKQKKQHDCISSRKFFPTPKNEITPIIPAEEHFGNFPDEILILLHSIAKVLECYPNSGKTFNLIRAGKNRKKQTACLLFKRKHVYLFFIVFNPNETAFF